MVQLERPEIPPQLAASGPDATQELWDAWATGQELVIRPGIYNHSAVKARLRQAQGDKCAYCETQNPTSHDVVEHYRPKNGWRQNEKDKLQQPEYFWLAYDWENMLFACDQCNDAGHKQNLFPLENPQHRATAAHPNVSGEKALLLNPYGRKDPEKHIEWNRDVPRPRKSSRYGRFTIKIFHLDQPSLLFTARQQYLTDTEAFLAAVEQLPPDSRERLATRLVFMRRISASAPWAGMLRSNLHARIEAL